MVLTTGMTTLTVFTLVVRSSSSTTSPSAVMSWKPSSPV